MLSNFLLYKSLTPKSLYSPSFNLSLSCELTFSYLKIGDFTCSFVCYRNLSTVRLTFLSWDTPLSW